MKPKSDGTNELWQVFGSVHPVPSNNTKEKVKLVMKTLLMTLSVTSDCFTLLLPILTNWLTFTLAVISHFGLTEHLTTLIYFLFFFFGKVSLSNLTSFKGS